MMQALATALVPILPYAIPPVVGAFIGYLTNVVAIRMLFRPLRAYRLLGVRLPLTPGIIPRQRHQLAISIGRMVARHLLTEDAVRSHTGTPRFHDSVSESVCRFTAGVLDAVPSEHSRDTVQAIVAAGESTIDQLIERFLHSEPFVDSVGKAAYNAVVRFAGTPVADYLPLIDQQLGDLMERLFDGLRAGDARRTVLDEVDRWITAQLRANAPIRSFVTDRMVGVIAETMEGAFEPTLDHAIEWLRTPEIRSRLSRHGRVILRRIIDKLSVVQRFFVSAAQYDRQLEERMPEIIDDLIATAERAAREPDNRRRVIEAVVGAIEKIRSQGTADAAYRGGIDLPAKARDVTAALLGMLGDEGIRKRLIAAASALVSRLNGRTVGEVVERFLGYDDVALATMVRARVIAAVRRPEIITSVSREIRAAFDRLFDRLEHQPLGSVIGITAEQKRRLDALLAGGIVWIIDRRLPDIVQTLDIERLVVDKVDSLDVAQVEQLLLMVIARHLKYINLFGALLGALIGGSQIFVSRLW